MNFVIYFVSAVLGFFLGATSGVAIPIGIAALIRLLSADKSDSGMGFLAFILAPCLALAGAKLGFDLAKKLISSKAGFTYLASGEGLYISVPFYVLGAASLALIIHMKLLPLFFLPFDMIRSSLFPRHRSSVKAVAPTPVPAPAPAAFEIPPEPPRSAEEQKLWNEIRQIYSSRGLPEPQVDRILTGLKAGFADKSETDRITILKTMTEHLRQGE